MKILITGGTGTLGQALIEEFSKVNDDYNIFFTFHNNVDKATILSKRYAIQSVNLADYEGIDNDFDVIVNNAAIVNSLERCEDIDINNWNETLRVNLTLPFIIIKKNLPHMREKGWGRIINISSVYGVKAEEGVTPYTVSKHGLIGLTRSVAKEYASDGITCNAVCPGTIESELSDRIADFYTSNQSEKEVYFKELTEAIPARRLVKPIEVAKLVLFIASKEAAYINGATLMIDGGYTA